MRIISEIIFNRVAKRKIPAFFYTAMKIDAVATYGTSFLNKCEHPTKNG